MSSPGPQRRARSGRLVLALLLGSLLFPGSVFAASGICHSARIEEPFHLPGGSLHPPGRLTLCEREAYSPVARFHEVKVDGARVTLLVGHREKNEAGPTEEPFLMFARGQDGSLTPLGYSYPSRQGMQSYAFGAASVVVSTSAANETETLLFVAARTVSGNRTALD